MQGVAAKSCWAGKTLQGLLVSYRTLGRKPSIPLRYGLGQPALGTQVPGALLGPALHPVVKGPVAADAGDGGPIGLSVHV